MADNPVISQITLPSNLTYDLKDAQARSDIAEIKTAISGGVVFKGETTTTLTDGSTTNPVTINGASYTAKQGDLVVSGNKEYVWDGSKWIELGDLSVLGSLAYKNSASATYTPSGSIYFKIGSAASTANSFTPGGTVTAPTITMNSLTSTGSFTPAGTVTTTLASASTTSTGAVPYISALGTKSFNGTASTITIPVTASGTVTITSGSTGTSNYTPGGNVSIPTISVSAAGATATALSSVSAAGTLPSFNASVQNENLTFSWNAGAMPTFSTGTYKTGDATYKSSQPTFTGTATVLAATFSGSSVNGSTSYTPNGTVTVDSTTSYLNTSSTWSGTQGAVSVSGTPTTASVTNPTFSGSATTVTWSGQQATITVS